MAFVPKILARFLNLSLRIAELFPRMKFDDEFGLFNGPYLNNATISQ